MPTISMTLSANDQFLIVEALRMYAELNSDDPDHAASARELMTRTLFEGRAADKCDKPCPQGSQCSCARWAQRQSIF